MRLNSKKNVKNWLKKYQIRPSRGLGQNFLVDKGAMKRIIGAANLQPQDIVLEIGPGTGNLTQELAKRVKKVIAVEKDRKMIEVLKETLKDYDNVEIIRGDVLKIFNFQFSIFNKFSISNYKIVANLPFYLTAPVIRKFLEGEGLPKEMILVVQKEVGQRITAKPPDMNLLAVSVQFYAKPKIIGYISKKSFWPRPKVNSAILQITPLINADRKLINADLFFKIVKVGFSQPRKQILNNLAKKLALSSPNGLALSPPNGLKSNKIKVKEWLLKNKIKPERRAETLIVREWIKLTKSYPNDTKKT